MQIVVPDASIILKWVLPPDNEHHVDQAWTLRCAIVHQQVQGMVPTLWYFEVGNTLARKYPDDAAGHLSDLRAFRLTSVRPDSVLEQQILHLTAIYGVTFYDASYHALAIVKDGVFVTPDEKYLGKVTAVGYTLHLKDWPLT